MFRILVINELNDFDVMRKTHFSNDKGFFFAIGLKNNGNEVYFLNENENANETAKNKELKYISSRQADYNFLIGLDFIILMREGMLISLLETYDDLSKLLANKPELESAPKIIVKSDSASWTQDKAFKKFIVNKYDIKKNSTNKWILNHFDVICVQTELFKQEAISFGIREEQIIVSNMAIPKEVINFSTFIDVFPKDDFSYLVENKNKLKEGKALMPLYYLENPDKKELLFKVKYKVVYTGRVKIDKGKLFYTMKNIFDILGEEYHLHIFPGSFYLPNSISSDDLTFQECSARNGTHLELLREKIFADSKNVFIHYPYEHDKRYEYLHFFDCGIDFSQARPLTRTSSQGNAKLLEYCSVGLPVVCEDSINNIFLVQNAKNAHIIKSLGTVEDYVNGIRKIVKQKINREDARRITLANENWDLRAEKFMEHFM